jgi:hypothetical protein
MGSRIGRATNKMRSSEDEALGIRVTTRNQDRFPISIRVSVERICVPTKKLSQVTQLEWLFPFHPISRRPDRRLFRRSKHNIMS